MLSRVVKNFKELTRKERATGAAVILGLMIFWAALYSLQMVFAAPPTTPYAPGEETDPTCSPGDPNCTVYPPLPTTLSTSTNITMGVYPLSFASGTFYIDPVNNRIGINTSSPAYVLSVSGTVNISGEGILSINGTNYSQYFINAAGNNGQLWQSDGSGVGQWVNTSTLGISAAETDPLWMAVSSTYLATTTAASTYLTIANAGNTYLKLTDSVTSSWNAAYAQTRQWDGGATGLVAATGRASLGLGDMALASTADYMTTGTLAVTYLTLAASTSLNYEPTQSFTAGSIAFASSSGKLTQNNSQFFWDNVNNRLGIGTTTPAYKLDVAGDIDASSTYRIRGTAIAYLPSQSFTAFLGTVYLGAGSNGGTNLSHSSGVEGWGDTYVGIGAGVANTTGYNNTGIGWAALGSNTSGGNNIGIGPNSLFSNTSGNSNIALGTTALLGNTIGTNNVAIGASAGYGSGGNYSSVIDTGMVFVGNNASRDLSVPSTTVLNNGIAIGYGATVATNNTVVLGNTSILTTILRGNIGIG
ncbi:MAG: hypothetical protein PHD72_04805, partial [Patescibacteria group bacterium]|nr:hypothetical protein [Patescibacteria group bacterium]